jgi:GNAT superfamily N-acetyltransferase
MTIEIRELPNLSGPDAEGLRAMFEDMYAHFERSSGRTYLRPNGFDQWIAQYEKLRGRNRTVCGAYDGSILTGFAEGLLRPAPAYFQPEIVGFVSHIYVHPAWRGKRLANDLFVWLKAWFVGRNVNTMELQVVAGNDVAMRFWTSLGFHADNTQMRGKID